MIAGDGDAFGGRDALLHGVPVVVEAVRHIGAALFALQDDSEVDLVLGLRDGPVDQRFIGDGAPRL